MSPEEEKEALVEIIKKYDIPADQSTRVIERLPSAEQLCNLAADHTAAETKFDTILDDILPKDPSDRLTYIAKWVCAWKAAQSIVTKGTEDRAEAKKDPLKVPEIADTERGQMWAIFKNAHPEFVLMPNTMAHRLFLAKFRKDLLVHGIVQPYFLVKVWLESDAVDPVPHWAKIDDLARIGTHTAPVRPKDLQSVDARIKAFWVATELLDVCSYDWESGVLRIIKALTERREEAEDPYTFCIRLDALIRNKIYKLQQFSKGFEKFSYP